MNKDEKSIIKQLVKRGIIGDFSTDRFDSSRTFVSYDKRLGLIQTLYRCEVLPARYQYYNADTFELVFARNVKWSDTPCFNDPSKLEGWGFNIYNICNFDFANELMQLTVDKFKRKVI